MKRGEVEFLVQGELITLPVEFEYSYDADPTGRAVMEIDSVLLNGHNVWNILVMDQFESLKDQAFDDLQREADRRQAMKEEHAEIAREFQREALAERENQRGRHL